MVPHLATALTGPINELEQRILDCMPAIERWFRLEWMEHTPPFYTAVDVRNAGYKLAPVDTNLFPDAWHLLSESMLPLVVQAAQAAVEKICPEARNLLVVPRSSTLDAGQLANLAQLRRVFAMAGLHVRMGSISPDLNAPREYPLPDGESITVEPVLQKGGRLMLADFDPCTILLNNDLRAGVPGILEDLHTQFLLPPLHAGWDARRKSRHLANYDEVVKRFGKLIGVDPWLMTTLSQGCGVADIRQPRDVQQLTDQVADLLARLRRRHKEYGVEEEPYAVLKADNRTAENAIICVRDAQEVAQRLAQLALQYPKRPEGSPVEWLVQEGVMTCERLHGAVAEPVVYTMDRYVVGGFYRVHPGMQPTDGLVVPGHATVPLSFEQGNQLPKVGAKPGASAPNRFYMYGVVARLAMLAASYELEATDPQLELLEAQ